MRPLPILSAVLLTAATPVFAQVTVDLHALQALPDHPAAGRPSRPPPSAAPSPTTAPTRAPGSVSVTGPVSPPSGTPAAAIATREHTSPTPAPATQPAMPETIPDTASLEPIAPLEPPAGAKPPPPPPVSATAATRAAPTTLGLRVTFAPGDSDLSPDSVASIKQLTATTPPSDSTTFNVLAYAPGRPDDPSTARRISLSRAMAVRSALVADGVPSARIFVRALGEQYGEGPPDRVDVSVLGSNSTANTATAQ